ncbi:MAG: Rrf2 family transcriptional regulator [Bryobacterales bacterium]|jgi:Rrf2 family protein|nr:Rrf2 family transcriptional regulator [Bryobacterales bacterium]
MRSSVKGEYALRALFDLAEQRPGQPIRIADIAHRQRIPQKFLELILSTLKQGGFVESRRGADGGYMLARPAENLSVGEVLRFLEGSRSARRTTEQGLLDPFEEVWRQVDDGVDEILNSTTFAGLVRNWRERRGSYVPDWQI